MNGKKLCLIIGCLALLGMAVSSAYAQSLRAGAAKMDVTPSQSDFKISTDFIRDHLFVRAIVVDDGRSCAAFVSVDGGGPEALIDETVTRAAAITKCPAENFIISGTHSHSATTGGGPEGNASTARKLADAIVSAAETAKSRLAPARVGYGMTQIDLNVNRDLFNSKQEWRQAPNPEGVSDKALAVVEFIGADDVPIGVIMNYAMHPINFYLSGVISGDFPGEASRYIEELFDNRAVAIFCQGPSGDQNPRMATSPSMWLGMREHISNGKGPFIQTVGEPPPPPKPAPSTGFNAGQAAAGRKAISPENLAAYRKVIERTGDYVVMLGTTLGANAVQLMRESMQPVDSARIWVGNDTITCPGRVRLDSDNPSRENVFPGYKDGPDVNIKVGLLRIGDIHFVTVNGEVYSKIALRLKREAPAAKTIMVTNVSRRAASGYIYSDDAYSHLTFQVIGSRLKPGCAEGKIVSKAIELMHRSGQ